MVENNKTLEKRILSLQPNHLDYLFKHIHKHIHTFKYAS